MSCHFSNAGTTEYKAPEILLEHDTYGKKVDEFSIGCVIFEILTATRVYHVCNIKRMNKSYHRKQWSDYNIPIPNLSNISLKNENNISINRMNNWIFFRLGSYMAGGGDKLIDVCKGLLHHEPNMRFTINMALQKIDSCLYTFENSWNSNQLNDVEFTNGEIEMSEANQPGVQMKLLNSFATKLKSI